MLIKDKIIEKRDCKYQKPLFIILIIKLLEYGKQNGEQNNDIRRG